MKKYAIAVIDPEIMSGTPCFAGTRVPVRNLLDYIEGGDTLDEFLKQFPTVSRKQAVAFLEQASELLARHNLNAPAFRRIAREILRRIAEFRPGHVYTIRQPG